MSCTGKFGGKVAGTLLTPKALLTSTLIATTGTDPPGSSLSLLDIVTYAILAVAGFLSLLFFVALCCTICASCCCSKARKNYRLDIVMAHNILVKLD